MKILRIKFLILRICKYRIWIQPECHKNLMSRLNPHTSLPNAEPSILKRKSSRMTSRWLRISISNHQCLLWWLTSPSNFFHSKCLLCFTKDRLSWDKVDKRRRRKSLTKNQLDIILIWKRLAPLDKKNLLLLSVARRIIKYRQRSQLSIYQE